MIRIAFVSTLAYNYFFPGKVRQAGGHTRIYHLARTFAKKKEYDVYCIIGDFGQPDLVIKDHVKLIKAPIDNPAAVVPVLKRIYELKPDILVDFCASPRLFLYYLLKKVTGLRYVFFTGSDNDVNGGYRQVENFIFDCFYKIGLRNSDSIIAQVPYHRDILKNRWKMGSHLVLSPYLDIKAGPKPEKDIILWVGRAAFYKRPELFISLVRQFPEQKFFMICNDSGYDDGFMIQKRSGKLDFSNLEYYDYVPYPEMDAVYKRARFLVNTSDFEGFSNTFIEAASRYVPVLSLNSDPNRMFSFHKCGFFCGGDMNRFNHFFEQMIGDDNLLKRLGDNAFSYAFSNHRLDQAVDSIDAVFKSILEIKHP